MTADIDESQPLQMKGLGWPSLPNNPVKRDGRECYFPFQPPSSHRNANTKAKMKLALDFSFLQHTSTDRHSFLHSSARVRLRWQSDSGFCNSSFLFLKTKQFGCQLDKETPTQIKLNQIWKIDPSHKLNRFNPFSSQNQGAQERKPILVKVGRNQSERIKAYFLTGVQC